MTATADPQNLPVTTDTMTQQRDLMMEQLYLKLNEAYLALETAEGEQAAIARTAIRTSWDIMCTAVAQLTDVSTLLVQQRDQAVTELSGVITALEDVDYNHPIVSEVIGNVYEEVMSQHNGNFWESLPYDVAANLGGKWNFMDAQTLIDLIIDHEDFDDEGWADDHGWSLEDMQKARMAIYKAVRTLKGKGE